MSSIRYAILSLLAREPLSGYDIKQYMNNRLGPFWKVGSNQVYPELSKMEAEGLVQRQAVEQHSYRPARKVYEITAQGKSEIIDWTLAPANFELNLRDEFLLKTYNAWLVEPDNMISSFMEERKKHVEILETYQMKLAELTPTLDASNSKDPLNSTIFIIDFGLRHEQMYIEWCDQMIQKLKTE
ncbi:PadR family transcriptional regulator [Paenibacillus taihuensis]|uniref:PadR family transcriptional regulator n=1 Tax=Paenibacillus taihuensis TaxID=1156355 RepID=A0A3D9RQQ8_9BACL|nr:PadR family transcriptional regulator [Paenibacillus taihuensis]REE77690.1 PadR family transcriptional regulator [Paenibacillus taihuensis]